MLRLNALAHINSNLFFFSSRYYVITIIRGIAKIYDPHNQNNNNNNGHDIVDRNRQEQKQNPKKMSFCGNFFSSFGFLIEALLHITYNSFVTTSLSLGCATSYISKKKKKWYKRNDSEPITIYHYKEDRPI